MGWNHQVVKFPSIILGCEIKGHGLWINTVDGSENPKQPPGMYQNPVNNGINYQPPLPVTYETIWIMGSLPYQLMQDFFHQLFVHVWFWVTYEASHSRRWLPRCFRGMHPDTYAGPRVFKACCEKILKNVCPRDPDVSSKRDFPYNPILGMGLRPSILF